MTTSPTEEYRSIITRFLIALLLSLYLSKRGYSKNSLNLSGALCAIPVGFFVTIANYSFSVCLLTFFVTSSKITKFRSEKKKKLEENFKHGGQRNAVQVLCNGGVALFLSLFYICEVGFQERPINFAQDYTTSIIITSLIGSLACCNGDTWSSEIGAVLSSTPRLITTFETVPAGTNGGVSFIGFVASALGGLCIGAVFFLYDMFFIQPKSFLTDYPKQYPILYLSMFAGLFGSIVDSYLGAWFQYSGYCSLRKKVVAKESRSTTHIAGMDVMSNDTVNLLANIITALVTPYVGFQLWTRV